MPFEVCGQPSRCTNGKADQWQSRCEMINCEVIVVAIEVEEAWQYWTDLFYQV